MARVRENKEILVEAHTRKELAEEIKKQRALGYVKHATIMVDDWEKKYKYYTFMRIKKW